MSRMNSIRNLALSASALALATSALTISVAVPGSAAAQTITCSGATTVAIVGAPENEAPGPITATLGAGPCALGNAGRLIFNHNDNSETGYRIPETTTITGTLNARIDFLAGHTALTRLVNLGGAPSFTTGSTTVHDGAELELEQSFSSETANPSDVGSSGTGWKTPFNGLILGSGLTVENGGRLTGQGAFGNQTADVTFHGTVSPHGFPDHANTFAGPHGRFDIGGTSDLSRQNVLTFGSDSIYEVDVDLTLPNGVLSNDLIVSNLHTVIEDGAQLRIRVAKPDEPTNYLVGRRVTFLQVARVSQKDGRVRFSIPVSEIIAGLPVPKQGIYLDLGLTEIDPPSAGDIITRDLEGADGVTRTYRFVYTRTDNYSQRELVGNFTLTEDSDTQLTRYLGLEVGEDTTGYTFLGTGNAVPVRSTLYLEVVQNRFFSEDANTANGIITAAALQAVGDYNPVYTRLMNLPTDSAAIPFLGDFFNAVSGEIHVGVRGLLTQDAYSVQRSVGRRLSNYEPGGAHLWAEALGGQRQLDDNGEAPKIKEEGYGILAGIDATLTGAWRVGLAGGWRKVDAKGPDAFVGEADISQWHLLAYTSGAWGNWRGKAGVGFSQASVETERSLRLVDVADNHLAADYNGNVAHVFGELSYVHALNSAAVEPFLGYSFVHAETDQVREVDTRGGDEALALLISGDHNRVAFTTLGVKARTTSFGPVTFDGLLGWRRGFGDLELQGLHLLNNRQQMSVRGANLSENAAVVELGARWRVTDTVTLDAVYDGVIGDEGHDHTARVGVSLRF